MSTSKDADPARTFRLCLQMPRPVIPITYRIPGADRYELFVEALSGTELADVYAGPRPSSDLVARCLLAGTRKAFRSAKELEATLDERVAKETSQAVLEALAKVPIVGLRDWDKWQEILDEGAEHASNVSTAWRLGGSRELWQERGWSDQGEILRTRVIDHPEWWFGVPQSNLIDCHWMAYQAARGMRDKYERKNV
jgi:hypothetical protein